MLAQKLVHSLLIISGSNYYCLTSSYCKFITCSKLVGFNACYSILNKGLIQLSEEGAVQVFRPVMGSDYILGAVGVLQFEVTMARLKAEYRVDAVYETVDYNVARWVACEDSRKLAEFEKSNVTNVFRDAEGSVTYLTTSEWQLNHCMEQWPEVEFQKTREVI